MKKGVLSIILAIIGLYGILRLNIQLYNEQPTSISNTTSSSIIKVYKMIALCIGFLSLYFGVISYASKYKYALLSIIFSLLVIVCSFIPFWKYA